jgi:sphingomyelin phosphodiesterase
MIFFNDIFPHFISIKFSGAFYTIKLISNLRVVSLNTNYCPKENFWLIINSTDPNKQLEWLGNVLQLSEDNNEKVRESYAFRLIYEEFCYNNINQKFKVHIIGHIDPSKCLESWSKNYYRIINRYESTIAGQFFGHTHKDEIKIYYDLNNKTRPVSVAYLAGSVTTASYLNPSYRIYTVDGVYDESSYHVLDHRTVYLNLTDANYYNVTKWRDEYSVKKDLGLTGLYPDDWDSLVNKLLLDLDGLLASKIYRY